MPTLSRTILVWALGAALGAGAIGCGSTPNRETRRELVREANRVCHEAQTSIDRLPLPSPPLTIKQVRRYLNGLLAVEKQRLSRLEALPQGSGEVGFDMYAFLFAEREATATLHSIDAHLADNPGAGSNQLEIELDLAQRALYRAGQQADNTLGACGVPGYLRSTNTINSQFKPFVVRSGGRATVDPAVAEAVVRNSIDHSTQRKFENGRHGVLAFRPRSVICPSGVAATPGSVLRCSFALSDGRHGDAIVHVEQGGSRKLRLALYTPSGYQCPDRNNCFP
jgi:hypothetical protein